MYTHTHAHWNQTELEKYDFRLAENFVFLKESEGFVGRERKEVMMN